MNKVFSWRFHNCFGTFNLVTVDACSNTALSGGWSNQLLESRQFSKYITDDLLVFVWKCLKFDGVSINGKKNSEIKFLFLIWYHLNREQEILKLRNKILVIASSRVQKQPYDFQLQSGRCFPNHFTSEWWKNMIKVLSWRFHKSLGTLNLLTLEECSDNAIFSEWSNQVLDSP